MCIRDSYYYNCIRDCDQQVARVLDSLKANGMDKNTIIVFTADHGELGGNHQMRGKGNCTYRQQNHLPLMIVHPAYPGGTICQAVTSQIDLAPTLLALTGADPAALQKAGADLNGRSFSALMEAPDEASFEALRPASLFNYNMLSFQDARWARKMDEYMRDAKAPLAAKMCIRDSKDVYYAENKILKALPKMAKAAHSTELKAAFQKHFKETEGQVVRLDKVFRLIDVAPKGKKCEAIEGIIAEGAEIMKEFKGTPALDAGLVSAAQAVEHYEICLLYTSRCV